MKPEWHDSGTINAALEVIGIPHTLAGDRFSTIGLDDVRDNDDILERIASQQGGTGRYPQT